MDRLRPSNIAMAMCDEMRRALEAWRASEFAVEY